jgi:hypothetical protein
MLAVLAAFFCLLFFAAAKKSRCRPAQGRRLKHEGKSRMPAKSPNATLTASTKKPRTNRAAGLNQNLNRNKQHCTS